MQSPKTLRALVGNRRLLRVCLAWFLFVLAEYAVWITMLVYAYGRGGAAAAGLIAIAQVVPGILAAPLLAPLADRRSPILLLVGGYVVQSAGMTIAAIDLYTGGPAAVAYAGAILASTAMTATRPAQAALTPALARTVEELTVSNAAFGWLKSVSTVLAGALTGLALGAAQPELVFAGGAVCAAVAAALVATVKVPGIAVHDDPGTGGGFDVVGQGIRVLKNQPESRLLAALITAQYVVVGALDLLFVVLAVTVLNRGEDWVGYLNTAYGIGAVTAAAVTIVLLGRKLTAPLVGAVGLVSLAVVATAFIDSALVILLLLGAVGLGISVLSTVSQTLLQRTVPAHLIGRVFGVIEGLSGVGLAVGSLLVPLLIQLGGARAALICTAAVLPLAALLGARALKSLDAAARVPVVEIALFRSLPHFRVLPTPELEGLSHAAVRMEFGHGEKIIVQGETGDLFYAISEGDVSIFVDGVQVATRKRPEGLGEIALLHNRPRSATAVAHGTVVLYALDGDTFISVVTGHDATRRRAEAVATARLSGHQSDPE